MERKQDSYTYKGCFIILSQEYDYWNWHVFAPHESNIMHNESFWGEAPTKTLARNTAEGKVNATFPNYKHPTKVTRKMHNRLKYNYTEEHMTDGQLSKATGYNREFIRRWREKHNLPPNYYSHICNQCGASFESNFAKDIYCPSCDETLFGDVSGKDKTEKRLLVRQTRQQYGSLIRSNPEKAKQLREEMLKEEGTNFTNLTLDGIYEQNIDKPEIQRQKQIISKYNITRKEIQHIELDEVHNKILIDNKQYRLHFTFQIRRGRSKTAWRNKITGLQLTNKDIVIAYIENRDIYAVYVK